MITPADSPRALLDDPEINARMAKMGWSRGKTIRFRLEINYIGLRLVLKENDHD